MSSDELVDLDELCAMMSRPPPPSAHRFPPQHFSPPPSVIAHTRDATHTAPHKTPSPSNHPRFAANTWPPREDTEQLAQEFAKDPTAAAPLESTTPSLPSTQKTGLDLLLTNEVLDGSPASKKSGSPNFASSPPCGKLQLSSFPSGPAPLDIDVQRVLNMCQTALEALVDPKQLAHAQHAEALSAIYMLKPRLQNSLKRAAHRHRRFSLSTDSRRILKQWFDAHDDNPYPTPLEKNMLAAAANMNVKQVNYWFTNYRKRHWQWNDEWAEKSELSELAPAASEADELLLLT